MDIVLRAALAFWFIFFLTRIVGRRELSAVGPFDLIMLIVLGDLVQQGVTQSDYSVTGLVLAAGTIAILQVGVSYVNYRFKRLRPLLEGEPIVLVDDGRVLERNLGRERAAGLGHNDLTWDRQRIMEKVRRLSRPRRAACRPFRSTG